MGTASCQRVREHRNQLSDGSAPQSGSSRNGLRNTDGVDREVQCVATMRALDKDGIAYDLVDLTVDDAARDYSMSLGFLFF
jgi:hypothetical protein